MIGALLLAALAVNHQPIDCFVKDRFPLLEVDVQPPTEGAAVRVFFRSENDQEFRFVPMTLIQGRFLGKLPRPREKARAIVYFIEVAGTDGSIRRTPEISGDVIKARTACPEGGRVADEGNDDSIRIFTAGKSTKKPGDFSGIDRVAREEGTAPAGEAAVASASPPPPSPLATAPPPTAPSPSASTPPKVDATEAYTIGPADILRIAVFGHEDLTQTAVVQEDGILYYPLLGRVKAADLTPKELERKITTLLGQGYIRNPQVTVAVQEYRSKSVFVLGEVARPGSYPIQGRMTVLELLAKAGPRETAGAEIVVLRPRRPGEGPVAPADLTGMMANPEANQQVETIRVNVREIQMGQLDRNIPVQPNDTIFVTQAARVFVTGEVRNPGPVDYFPGLTVRKAVYAAGGFTSDASQGRLRVFREVEGKFKEIKIGIDDPVHPAETIIVKAKLF